MNTKYKSQTFCQGGFEHESSPAFITCHIIYTRMLTASDNGGPTEVYLVMQKAPIDTHCMGMNMKVCKTRNKDQVPQEKP